MCSSKRKIKHVHALFKLQKFAYQNAKFRINMRNLKCKTWHIHVMFKTQTFHIFMRDSKRKISDIHAKFKHKQFKTQWFTYSCAVQNMKACIFTLSSKHNMTHIYTQLNMHTFAYSCAVQNAEFAYSCATYHRFYIADISSDERNLKLNFIHI